MLNLLKDSLWGQFGAAIDFLAESMAACPKNLWEASLWEPRDKPIVLTQFWYVGYHTLFWLDLYLTGTEDSFLPPAPFELIEQHDSGPLPARVYTQAELLDYLAGCRERAHATVAALTEQSAAQRCEFGWGACNFYELQLYNLRHVHGHASQLNMLLGQNGISIRDWIPRAKD